MYLPPNPIPSIPGHTNTRPDQTYLTPGLGFGLGSQSSHSLSVSQSVSHTCHTLDPTVAHFHLGLIPLPLPQAQPTTTTNITHFIAHQVSSSCHGQDNRASAEHLAINSFLFSLTRRQRQPTSLIYCILPDLSLCKSLSTLNCPL